MPSSSLTPRTSMGLVSSSVHGHSVLTANRICSNCHSRSRVWPSPAFEHMVKWALLVSVHSPAAAARGGNHATRTDSTATTSATRFKEHSREEPQVYGQSDTWHADQYEGPVSRP